MSEVHNKCAIMAAAMLDMELVTIIRRLDEKRPSPLQIAVANEAVRRGIVPPITD